MKKSPSKTVTFSIRVPIALRDRIKAVAVLDGARSASSLVASLLEREISKIERLTSNP